VQNKSADLINIIVIIVDKIGFVLLAHCGGLFVQKNQFFVLSE
jgi:hypothetical protein